MGRVKSLSAGTHLDANMSEPMRLCSSVREQDLLASQVLTSSRTSSSFLMGRLPINGKTCGWPFLLLKCEAPSKLHVSVIELISCWHSPVCGLPTEKKSST